MTVEAEGWCWLAGCDSETMMVAGLTLLLCLSLTAIHCNIEFKHHNNTELAAILQKVRGTNYISETGQVSQFDIMPADLWPSSSC